MRSLALAGIACLALMSGETGARATWRLSVWRPALDAVGNAQPPAMEGVAAIPDGVDLNPETPSRRGKVTVDDSTTIPPTVQLRKRKIMVIER